MPFNLKMMETTNARLYSTKVTTVQNMFYRLHNRQTEFLEKCEIVVEKNNEFPNESM